MKAGTNRRHQTLAWVGTLATAMSLASNAAAEADRTGVIVVGKAPEHDRVLVANAVNEAVSKAWTVDSKTFKADELDSITKCLQNDRPWACIEPTVHGHRLDRLVIVQVDLKAPNTPAINAQLVFSDGRIPPEETRFCERCTDATLIASTHDLMSALLRRANEVDNRDHPHASTETLVVRSNPPGASITIDGRPAGQAGIPFATTVGHHTVDVDLPGYRHEQRTVDVTDTSDQTLAVDLTVASGDGGGASPSKVLPITLLVGGGALALGCIGYGFTLDPPSDRDQPHVLVSWPAVGGAVVGAAAVGTGLYLLLRHQDQPRSVPTASTVPGGAVLGWMGSFQ